MDRIWSRIRMGRNWSSLLCSTSGGWAGLAEGILSPKGCLCWGNDWLGHCSRQVVQNISSVPCWPMQP